MKTLKIDHNQSVKRSFFIYTLGCKVNIYESESITGLLISAGYSAERSSHTADLVIINTCTVTIKADSKTRNLIHRVKKENPQCILILCGCLVDTTSIDLTDYPDVELLIRNNDKDKIIHAIEYYQNHRFFLPKPYLYQTIDDGSFNHHPARMSKHSRAFLKIQDGCDNQCSYCKIPQVRGKSRSKKIADIITDINTLIGNHYEEIVLTGINLGSYFADPYSFPSLLVLLAQRYPQIRFRISSLEPQYINEAFLTAFELPNICPHLHIPLQNGSDKILTLMNRHYTVDQYQHIIRNIRIIKPDTFISTDLILGFPGETEEDFAETLRVIRQLQFAFIHLFGFSPRPSTPAFQLKPKIPERLRDQRLQTVQQIMEQMNLQYRQRFLNHKLMVVIERKRGEFYCGKSENYLDILIKTGEKLLNKKIYPAYLSEVNPKDNLGVLVPRPINNKFNY